MVTTMHALILALLLISQAPPARRSAQTGSASGVIRTATGAPAAGVRVAAVALSATETATVEGALVSLTQTDSSGRYRLDNILPGRYYIQAGLIDAPTYYPGVTTTAGATNLLVAAGASLDGLNFTMSQGSGGVRVSGRVPSTSTRPVLIALLGGSAGPRPSAQIRADGTFEFPRVTPGSYTLQASPANGLPPLPIVVSDKDIDIGMPAGPGVRVSGVVGLGARSPRPAGQKVLLIGSSAWAQVESTLGPGGTFSMPSVPAGIYTLKTLPGSVAPLATVVVADREIAGITVGAYAELAGKAVLQDGATPPKLSPALTVEARLSNGQVLATVIRSDGTFRFPLPEGEYRIALGKLPVGTAVKSLTYGSVDLLKDPLILDGSGDLNEIRVVLEMKK